MHIDLLVAEIGSTTTLINAFDGIFSDCPKFLGQGQAPTTVLEGDVLIGLFHALENLKTALNASNLTYSKMLATSSAAGGLKMCVSGLVYDMTVKAAHAAALGAGAIVKHAAAGRLNEYDIEDFQTHQPNLILLAGGTDYGERETAIHNAKVIAKSNLNAPVVYAGNIQCRTQVAKIFEEARISCVITENVYPRLDMLNIEPARRAIHEAFEAHITNAPGMKKIREMVSGTIIPTPGAVMEASLLLYDELGDVMVVDIGGATTDVHSISHGTDEINSLQTAPEPFAKRTVEGDLGLYVNAKNLVELVGEANLGRELALNVPEVMANYEPIPKTETQLKLTQRLCVEAGTRGIMRHCGALRYVYTPSGRKTVAEGKDLTPVKHIVGTGGALTRLPDREPIMRTIADCNANGMLLLPKPGKLNLLFDNMYIMASAGVIAKNYPIAAKLLLMQSLKFSV